MEDSRFPDVLCYRVGGYDYSSIPGLIDRRKAKERSRMGRSVYTGCGICNRTSWEHELDCKFLQRLPRPLVMTNTFCRHTYSITTLDSSQDGNLTNPGSYAQQAG